MTYPDIEALVSAARTRDRQGSTTAGDAFFSEIESIRDRYEHMSALEQVLALGLDREFSLRALDDLAQVRDVTDAQIRSLTTHVVRDLDVPAMQVARILRVAPSTVARWLKN